MGVAALSRTCSPDRPVPGWMVWMGVLVATLLLCACDGQVELISQITEGQANDVIAALSEQGIAAEKLAGKEGMVAVRVSQSKVARAIQIMHAAGLPREPYESMGDIFKKDGLISSPTEERARMLFALSQELSHTISQIDGVIYAQVHIVLPERGGFGETGNPSSAAVFIKYEDTTSVDAFVPQIRRLVANSIPGLTFEKVSVELVPSARPAQTATSSETRLETVWSIQVAAASAALLRDILGGLTLAVLAAGGGVAFVVFKMRRGEQSHA